MDRSEADNDVNDEVQDVVWCQKNHEDYSFRISFGTCSDSQRDDSGTRPRVYHIDIFPRGFSSTWTVTRNYQDFLDLHEFYTATVVSDSDASVDLVLPLESDCDPTSFELFLRHLLYNVGDFVWGCPQILFFFDDSINKPNIRDVHLAILTQKIVNLTTGYSDLENRMFETQEAWNILSNKLLKLEQDSERSATVRSAEFLDITDGGRSQIILNVRSETESLIHAETINHSGVESGPAVHNDGDILTSLATHPVTEIVKINHLNAEDILTGSFLQPNIHFREACSTNATSDPPLLSAGDKEVTNQSISDCVHGFVENSEIITNSSANDTDEAFNMTEIVDAYDSSIDIFEEPAVAVPKIHCYRDSCLLPYDVISQGEAASRNDAAIEVILSLLTPHEHQHLYRTSARAFLGRAVRHSLKAKLFETGLHALQTFLPDDPIRLTVLLWRGNSTNWLSNLGDRLKNLEQAAGGPESVMGMSGPSAFDDEVYVEANSFDIDNEPKPCGDHIISNINPSTTNGHSRMLCVVDAVSVEIVPNGRSDLCFLALVEEISQLVGKQDLFKRSLLLVRGWWTYETSAYVGIPTKNFLSDTVICVLVCSIFNQYHAVIHQPLQALSIFLAEYSDIKWSEVAITLQGVVPFHEKGVLENQPWLREPLPSELVTSAILQKHCDFYHMSSTSATTSRASATPRQKSPGDTQSTIDATISSDRTASDTPDAGLLRPATTMSGLSFATTCDNTAPSSVTATPYGPCLVSTAATVAAAAALLASKVTSLSVKKLPSDSHCYSPTAVRNFQKRFINIVHPLTNANMVSTSVTIDRVHKITLILEKGAHELHVALKSSVGIRATDENISKECQMSSPFEKFFRGTLIRFNTGWRPDLFDSNLPGYGTLTGDVNEYDASSRLTKDRGALESLDSHAASTYVSKHSTSTPSLQLPLERFFDQIRYMDLVLVGRVSESALLALSQDILVGRGVLPVGEIGKSLQDIAPTRNLSGKIKEKYGGLKKFLERYPDEVVICADHPFNPHVFLRKPLSAADLDLIGRGIIPPHLRKAMALRNKMRGGGTTIGALDGHVGPSSNNYLPGSMLGNGQMSGQSGSMNGGRLINMNMGSSEAYNPHNPPNMGAQSMSMQSHMPGLRSPRNVHMMGQNQGFSMGQNMNLLQIQHQHSQGDASPLHLQSPHQQHLHQAHKMQQQSHQLINPQVLGINQGPAYRDDSSHVYRSEFHHQGGLSPLSPFSSHALNQRMRDEMNANLSNTRGVSINDMQSRGSSIGSSAFNSTSNSPRNGHLNQGQNHFSQVGDRGNMEGCGNKMDMGMHATSINNYNSYSGSRERRTLSEREREIHSLLLNERLDVQTLNPREGFPGGQAGQYYPGPEAGRRRLLDLNNGGLGLGLGDATRDTVYSSDRMIPVRCHSLETYRESQGDLFQSREQYRDHEALRDQSLCDSYRSDAFRDHPDSPPNHVLPTAFGLPLSLSSHATTTASRGPSLSMLSAAKNFSERDKLERIDRGRERSIQSTDPWVDQLFSLESDKMEDRDRERDRYSDLDYGGDAINSGLFSTLGSSSSQMLPDDNQSEYFDLRAQGGYQQSFNSSVRNNRGNFLRDLNGSQELLGDDEQHQHSISLSQGTEVRQEYAPSRSQFDPSKWI